MPQQTIFTREWLRSSWLRRSALSLTIILLASGSIHAATSAKGSHAADSTEPTRYSASVVRADVNGETVANGRQLTLEPGSVDGTRALLPSKLLKEDRQAGDRPARALPDRRRPDLGVTLSRRGALVRLDRRPAARLSGMVAVALQPMVGSAPGLDFPDLGRGRGDIPASPHLSRGGWTAAAPPPHRAGTVVRLRDGTPDPARDHVAGALDAARGHSPAQCSSRSRMPPITSRMPITSVRFGRSWKKKTAAAKVNTSSIWPSART